MPESRDPVEVVLDKVSRLLEPTVLPVDPLGYTHQHQLVSFIQILAERVTTLEARVRALEANQQHLHSHRWPR